MNRFTPDAMLGIESPEILYERNRPLDQASIDRIKRPNGRDAILAQQREEWPDYRAIRRPGRSREEQVKLAIAVLIVAGAVAMLLLWSLLRWRSGAGAL